MKFGIPGFNGERLRQARLAMGLKQASLAQSAGVSKQAISQYELGADSPGPEVFDRLRGALKFDAHFFLRQSFRVESNTRFYRSMASATHTARSRAEARMLMMRELLSFVTEYVEFPAVNFPERNFSRDPKHISVEEIESVAAEARAFWNLGDAPINNIVELAEMNGAVIIRHGLDSAALDALSEWIEPEDMPLVVLNADKNVAVRSRMDIAHELGHLICHRHVSPEYLEDPERFDLIEQQAFRFGAALLLPERGLLGDLYSASLDALRSLKLKWKVSIAMMIERLKDLSIIDQQEHRRLRINYNNRKWMREEPYDSEIEVEQPTTVMEAVRLITERKLITLDQISASSGLSRQWIEELLALPPEPSPRVELKVLEFRRRA